MRTVAEVVAKFENKYLIEATLLNGESVVWFFDGDFIEFVKFAKEVDDCFTIRICEIINGELIPLVDVVPGTKEVFWAVEAVYSKEKVQ